MRKLTHRNPSTQPEPYNSQQQQHRTADSLESQNDEAIENLSNKVQFLKQITINIGTELNQSSTLISDINDSFSDATGLLAGTFRRMNVMSKRQTGRWWYWLLFLVVVFWIFFLTWWWRH